MTITGLKKSFVGHSIKGESADIWRGDYGSQAVAIKVLRNSRQTESDERSYRV